MSVPVVLDNGSGLCKAGFASEPAPTAVFASVIGRLKKAPQSSGYGLGALFQKDSYAGEAAEQKRGILNLKQPIEHGLITDWDGMEKVWHHAYHNQMRISPKEHPLLLTEPLFHPKNREQSAQILFENFDVPALCIANPAALALYATDRFTGVVLDVGEGVSQAVPVYEGVIQMPYGGYVAPDAVSRSKMGGKLVTEYLAKLLEGIYHGFKIEVVQGMKEKICYVSHHYDQELEAANTSCAGDKNFRLPDGQIVKISSQRFMAPEILFQPAILDGNPAPGIHDLILNAITKCDVRYQKELFENIIICGGTSMLPGLVDRVRRDIRRVTPAGVRVEVTAPKSRKYLPWIGGAVYAMQPGFENTCISKQQYYEFGPSYVMRKCL